ncbi:hypothetical protein IJG20_02645 [Candidatus Saccharibacteria bacterium]|nr:hypothetical protein [Candidatus Saccharibacteria bacterium]
MSGNNTKINERSDRENKVPEENVFYIPREGRKGKVVKAMWRDDVEEMAKDIDEEIGYETFKDEASYESPSDAQIVDKAKFEDEKKLSEIIKRAKAQKIGIKVLGVYRKAA